jgi:hypothetical protein
MRTFHIQSLFWRIVFAIAFGTLACIAWFDYPCTARPITLKQTVAIEKAELFSLIQKLEHNIPFKHDVVSKLCGRPLELDSSIRPTETEQTVSDFCTETDCGQLISKIAVKEADEFTRDLGGEAYMEINPDYAHITAKEIISYFGKESSIDTSPYCRLMVEVQPWIYEYKRSWGTLFFTVSDEEPHYLMQVFLNAWERRPLSSIEWHAI